MVVLFLTLSVSALCSCIHSKDPKAVYLLTRDLDLRLDLSFWELIWEPHDEVLADITMPFPHALM